MDHNIYEEMYERLLSEGLDEDIATAVVNKMHDREELHDVEYIDEGIFKAATTIGRVAAKMMGFGKVSSRAARGAGVGTLRTLNRRGSEAFQRGIRRANWTPGKALPSGSKGGPLASGGGKLGPVSKIEPVTVKDLGPSRMAAGQTKAATAAAGTKGTGTTYQGTRSGGQLPPAGQNRMSAGQTKAATAAAGSKGTGVTYQGTRSGGQLPPAGQTTSRVGRAQQKAADAAKGSTAVGTNYTSRGVRQLGPEKLASKVKRTASNLKTTLAGAGAATLKGVKRGASAVNKLPTGAKLAAGAALVGVTAAGLGVKDPLAKKTGEINLPDKDTAPTTPPGGVVADKGKKDDTKGPGGYTIPDAAKPKTDGSVGKTFDPAKDLKPKKEKTREQELADIRAQAKADTIAKGKKKPFDIRDRDITARAQYDPRLKSERERMKRIKAERRAAKELKKMRAESLERQGRLDEAKVLRYEIDQMNSD